MTVQHDFRAIYNRAFFAEQIDGAARSARIVAPLVMKLVRNVRSVVEVGCKTGVWLASFKDAGAPRVLGLDDGAFAEQGQLEIEPDEFQATNLEWDIDLDESFDLCICLELTEHHTHRAAAAVVQNICKLSDVVLFSIAIPGQGVSRQFNEHWPSYWVDLFASAGYEVVDTIRGRIWNDARVEWWYRQNLLLFANKAGLSRIAPLLATKVGSTPLDIIHPSCFEQYCRLIDPNVTLSQKVSSLERRSADLERALQAILNSTSWKLTWPLRRAIGNDENRRRKLRALVRIGWLIVSAKFLRRLPLIHSRWAS